MEIGKQVAIGAGFNWNKFEEACGTGSRPHNNIAYCKVLSAMIQDYEIKSVSDYGCGNLQTYRGNLDWQKLGVDYTGYDAHVGCVQELKKRYPQYKFNTIELQTLPPEDEAIIIKDVLIHWFDSDIIWFFEEAVKRFKYIIYMHDTTDQGYPNRVKRTGSYRDPDPKIREKVWDEHFFGYKSVPVELIPQDRILVKTNVKGDSMKTFMVIRGN